MSEAFVSALYVYPVKSCRGIRVPRAEVVRRGFAADRRWMIVDESGRFRTQRETPALCRVATELSGAGIRLTVAGLGSCELPLALAEGSRREVEVWSHRGPALSHEEGSRFISAAIGQPSSLVYMPDSHERPVKPQHARSGDIVGFADAFPFLVISEGSLMELNRRLATPLEMERFRPNIVVSGVLPHAEDGWARVRIGRIDFRGPKGCDRCVITTRDPTSGEAGKEPLHTLATYRKRDGKVWFGMNLIHEAEGELAVGDPVQPLE